VLLLASQRLRLVAIWLQAGDGLTTLAGVLILGVVQLHPTLADLISAWAHLAATHGFDFAEVHD